jgi:hypothetical protein
MILNRPGISPKRGLRAVEMFLFFYLNGEKTMLTSILPRKWRRVTWAPADSRPRFRPHLECLESRVTPAATASLSQWQNVAGGWVNGDLNPQKASLFEGDSVAYQESFTGLKTGSSNVYKFTIQFDTTKAGQHAQDYLTSFDYTWHGGSNSGTSADGHELDGTTTPAGTPFLTAAIPSDPNINPGPSSPNFSTNTMLLGHSPVAGSFKMFGATSLSVVASSYQIYPLTGTTFQTLTVSFTTSIANPTLLWGGHIASRLDWGPGNSASFISGSPYHMSQAGLTDNGSTVPIGSQDRSIKVGVVVFPTIIVVNKIATPNAAPNQNFNFTNTSNVFFAPQQPTNFVNSFTLTGSNQFIVPPYTLPPANATNATVLETSTFNNTALTRITENVPSGWALSSIAFFSEFNNTGNSSSGSTAILNCNGDDTLWLTYTDQVTATSLVTTANPNGTITLGTGTQTLKDSAVLSGGSNPQGTITFTLKYGTTTVDTEPVPVNGDGTYSTPTGYVLPTTTTVTGGYAWSAVYTPAGGDPNSSSSDPGTSAQEQVTVNKASPGLVTTPSAASINLGGTATDTATLSGGYFPTGTITFTLTDTDSNTAVYTNMVNVTSGNADYTSGAYVVTAAGNYQWSATYNGDGNNNAITDTDPAQEVFTVPKNPTAIVTTASPNITLGTTAPTITDAAVLSGGYNPTGSITFTLTLNGTAVPAATQTDTVSGNGSYTAQYTLPTSGTVAGTYIWSASYTGDPNNLAASETGSLTNGEATVVSPAPPTLVTTAGATVNLSDGNKLTDTANLQGGYFPTGSITFYLFPPGANPNTTGSGSVYSTMVPVNGDSTYTAPGYQPTVAGLYHWSAVYSGDGNNNSAFDPGTSAAESETVTAPSLSITKSDTGGVSTVLPGQMASFTITVSNTGTGAANNVVVTDPLPEDPNNDLNWTANSGAFTVSISASHVLTGTAASLAAGATATIVVSAVVPVGEFGNPPNGSSTDGVPAGLFELDGNATTNSSSSHDWDQVFADAGSPTVSSNTQSSSTGFSNGASSKALAGNFTYDAYNTTVDNIFTGGGSKDPNGISNWMYTSSKPQGKDDIENAAAALYIERSTDPNPGDVILYSMVDRYDNSGNSTMGFWFFVNPLSLGAGGAFTGAHTTGDILLISNFTQGGSVSTIAVYEWVGTDSGGSLVPLNGGNPIAGKTEAVVNSGPITVPWHFLDKGGSMQPAAGEFLEEGINLTSLGLNACFTSFMAETRSSQSVTATLSDFALGAVFQTCLVTLPNTATVSASNFNSGQPITSNQAVVTITDGMMQLAASSGPGTSAGLTSAQLQALLPVAINNWRADGFSSADLHALDNVTVQVTNLSGGLLGLEAPGHIWIDSSAAGWGWSINGGQMDLQTVVTHEVGHVLGFADHNGGNDIMTTTLAPGVQRLPEEASSAVTAAPAAPASSASSASSANVAWATIGGAAAGFHPGDLGLFPPGGSALPPAPAIVLDESDRNASTDLVTTLWDPIPLAPSSLRPAGPPAAAVVIDLLFESADGSLFDEATQAPSSSPDTARLDKTRDALVSSNDVLSDRADQVAADPGTGGSGNGE